MNALLIMIGGAVILLVVLVVWLGERQLAKEHAEAVRRIKQRPF